VAGLAEVHPDDAREEQQGLDWLSKRASGLTGRPRGEEDERAGDVDDEPYAALFQARTSCQHARERAQDSNVQTERANMTRSCTGACEVTREAI